MSKTVTNQILIATVATVLAGVILDKLRHKPTPPPVADNSSNWFNWGS